MDPSPRRLSRDEYTVACICPMGVELAAVEGMLDEIHENLPSSRDQNGYTLGRMGAHNVVAVMPEIGNNRAAVVATQLLNDFQSIRFGLLVGIGGGIPGEDEDDIRLGDVVVSKPTATFGGVVQYDMGKVTDGGLFQRTGSLTKPPAVLSANVHRLQAQQARIGSQVPRLLSEMQQKYPKMGKKYAYQGVDNDRLFEAIYPHQAGGTCKNCNPTKVVDRVDRPDTDPQIHYGTIGSGNAVIKDGATRERLREELGVLCVEMEAAGLMDEFSCLVIRGICDDADSHKNKRWQPYAAATAAAYAKELLSIIPAQEVVAASKANKSLPETDIRSLNPAIPTDRDALYRLFRASLPTEPVSRDDSNAGQGYLFSELILFKYHAQGPWNYWIRSYLQEGYSVNVRDFRGKTPLHHALVTKFEREDKVRTLVDVGADVTMRDFEDETPVDLAQRVDEGLFTFLLRTWQRSVATK